MKIELYIKNRLCDINSPESLGIRLKRQFVNPAELSVKDAQKSYEVILPATPVNNEIFSHVNVEEVRGKFRVYEDARLYADGVLILDGKFRLSEITRDGYKGNLGVPAPLTAKDIFGETVMNQAGKWEIPFTGFSDLTTYNTGGHDKAVYGDISPCIFPLVLYGLLPKSPSGLTYSPKNMFDDSVRLSLDNLPPSVNCIHMLKKIFSNAGYTLTGSAVDDERISNLYVSYRNPAEYEMPWPVNKIELSGHWQSIAHWGQKEMQMGYTTADGRPRTTLNYFFTSNGSVKMISDEGRNMQEWDKRVLKIPATGLYKLTFTVDFAMLDEELNDKLLQVRKGDLNKIHTEVKIIRNYNREPHTLKFDNTFYIDNQLQRPGENDTIFPKKGEVNFIDPKQNKDFIAGFAFGKYDDPNYINPLDTDHCNPMAILGGQSWSMSFGEEGVTDRAYSAVKSTGYVNTLGQDVNKYVVDLNKKSFARRDSDKKAYGEIHQVIWLEKGDTLDILDISFMGGSNVPYTSYNHSVEYYLSLEPFRHTTEWLKMDDEGNSFGAMDWNDESSFINDKINLVRYLPNGIKVQEWIDNFCKAFNLSLTQNSNTEFELKVKGNEIANSISCIIDMDKRANVAQRRNEPLKLPSLYSLGFTVDNGEEGYYESIKEFVTDEKGNKEKKIDAGDNGGGKYYTGSNETNELSQTSGFSYDWYKELKIEEQGGSTSILVPVITDHDIWEKDYDYKEMMSKVFFDKAQRFWYKTGTKSLALSRNNPAEIAIVENAYKGVHNNLVLNYKDEQDSIMRNFFLLLADSNNNYTVIDCYLTPEEYSNLHKSLVRFNGDLYHIAEVDGYDPLGQNKCTLKLIRKII